MADVVTVQTKALVLDKAEVIKLVNVLAWSKGSLRHDPELLKFTDYMLIMLKAMKED